MGSIGNTLQRKRWGGGGLLLLALLAVLLATPLLRHRDASHPLSASERTDLCPLLPAPPAPLSLSLRKPSSEVNAATCEFRSLDTDAVLLRVGLSSTRQLSTPTPARSSKVYAVWVKEVAASSGRPVTPLTGDWAAASAWQDTSGRWILVEDHGVLLSFQSNALDETALETYARAVTTALRTASDAG